MTAAQILALRKHLGLSQAAFAARVGVHSMTVSRWERGTVRPSTDTVRMLRRLAS